MLDKKILKIALDHSPKDMELILFYFGMVENTNNEIIGLFYDENTKKYSYSLESLKHTPYFWVYNEIIKYKVDEVFTIKDTNGLTIYWKRLNKEVIEFWLE